jgi:hypothetical protein
MKNKVYVLLAFIILSISAGAQTSIKELVGKWETADGGGLEIIDGSRIFLVYGKERTPVLSYTVDFTKKPAWFDFTVRSADSILKMKSILQLNGADEMKWQVLETDVRPATFQPSAGEILVLKKKK